MDLSPIGLDKIERSAADWSLANNTNQELLDQLTYVENHASDFTFKQRAEIYSRLNVIESNVDPNIFVRLYQYFTNRTAYRNKKDQVMSQVAHVKLRLSDIERRVVHSGANFLELQEIQNSKVRRQYEKLLVEQIHDLPPLTHRELCRKIKQGDSDLVIQYLWKGRVDRLNALLEEAAEAGQLEIVKALIAKGADPNWGALDSAAVAGRIEIMDYLLKHGAKCEEGTIDYAIRGRQLDMIHKLQDLGADKRYSTFIRSPSIEDPLAVAISAEVYLAQSFSPGWEERNERAHIIARAAQSDRIERYIHHFDKNMKPYMDDPTFGGETPLDIAIKNNWSKAVEVLVREGADKQMKGMAYLRAHSRRRTQALEAADATRDSQTLPTENVKVKFADGVVIECNRLVLSQEFSVFQAAFKDSTFEDLLDLSSTGVTSVVFNKVLQCLLGVRDLSDKDLHDRSIALFLHKMDARSFDVLGLGPRGEMPERALIVQLRSFRPS